jgi:hypothetical protein
MRRLKLFFASVMLVRFMAGSQTTESLECRQITPGHSSQKTNAFQGLLVHDRHLHKSLMAISAAWLDRFSLTLAARPTLEPIQACKARPVMGFATRRDGTR